MNNNTNLEETRTARPSDHLANERTFLAWIRTSIALMGFGFVIVKFAIFIRQITIVLGNKELSPGKTHSAITGVVMVALGAITATLAYFRYRSIEKQLNKNVYFHSDWIITLVTISLIIGSILLVVYLLPNV